MAIRVLMTELLEDSNGDLYIRFKTSKGALYTSVSKTEPVQLVQDREDKIKMEEKRKKEEEKRQKIEEESAKAYLKRKAELEKQLESEAPGIRKKVENLLKRE